MTELLESDDGHVECVTCGHEWDEVQVVEIKDAYGNVLQNGDVVAMIKDLKMKGSSHVLKLGTKSKPIHLQDGDHEIACKMDNMSINLKAMYVKKVQ